MPLTLSFADPSCANAWKTLDDIVMGGRSHSQIQWLALPSDPDPGFLRFSGQTSLENNGGFCSTRNLGHWNLQGALHLHWTLRGTNRLFAATLRDQNTPDGASFRAPFHLTTDTWSTISLPLDSFRLFRRGQPLSPLARIDPSTILSFGFLLADHQAGPFHLDIRALNATP